mmetsp:Transcript_23471/g.52976  ORF Transcript_23471/g.52976 Transcript_23471/m.52976 type:complete len:212 (+) Transcript_23471:309-944(+)
MLTPLVLIFKSPHRSSIAESRSGASTGSSPSRSTVSPGPKYLYWMLFRVSWLIKLLDSRLKMRSSCSACRASLGNESASARGAAFAAASPAGLALISPVPWQRRHKRFCDRINAKTNSKLCIICSRLIFSLSSAGPTSGSSFSRWSGTPLVSWCVAFSVCCFRPLTGDSTNRLSRRCSWTPKNSRNTTRTSLKVWRSPFSPGRFTRSCTNR